MTGDVDLTSPVQPELEEELVRLGFTKPEGLGHTPLGCIHPELRLGFEVVASTPMDGTVDYRRLLLVEGVADTSIVMIPVEDLIADRMDQYASRQRARNTGTGLSPEPVEGRSSCLSLTPASTSRIWGAVFAK